MDATKGEPAPPELRLGWECDRWHCLPDTGAYLDQDYSLMIRITTVMSIYSTVTHYRSLQGAAIHSLTDGQRRLLKHLMDLGVL